MIINLINGKKYIGSTTNYSRRFKKHFYELRKGIHGNKHLQQAYVKYGEEMFKFLILEKIEDITILRDRELEYIHQYNTLNNKFGYNMSSITKGVKVKQKKVYQYSLEGVLINSFENCCEAGLQVLGDIKYGSNIAFCARGNHRFSKGFIWLYEDNLNSIKERVEEVKKTRLSEDGRRRLRESRANHPPTEEAKRKMSETKKGKSPKNLSSIQKARRVKVAVYNKDMDLLESFDSITKCLEKYNKIGQYINGAQKGKLYKRLNLYFKTIKNEE